VIETVKTGEIAEDVEIDADKENDDPDKAPKIVYVGRMKTFVKRGLRTALAVYMVFWTMQVWGIHFTLGVAISNALFSILITVLICYVVWELINTKIQQKLSDEMPGDDEEMEEGGAGGSRIGTLLLLLQIFFFIVIVVMVVLVFLSSLGVDIGPLIAGAGIVGIAIGFGHKHWCKI